MSTRGSVALTHKGRTLVGYVHGDAYPGGLGVDVLQWAQSIGGGADLGEVRAAADSLAVVDEAAPMTGEHRAQFAGAGFEPVRLGDSPMIDYYSGMRAVQGDLAAMLAAGVFPITGATEAQAQRWRDQVGHTYGYEVDLDAGVLIAMRRGSTGDRFAWPLTALPDEETFIDTVEGLSR